MFELIAFTALTIFMVAPIIYYSVAGKKGKNMKKVFGISVSLYFTTLVAATVLMFSGVAFGAPEAAAATSEAANVAEKGMGFLAAALVTGLATISAGIAVASSASAAIGAISENPKNMGKALIFVALAEGIALYGLLVSFTILGKI